jgi:hypothetical protein
MKHISVLAACVLTVSLIALQPTTAGAADRAPDRPAVTAGTPKAVSGARVSRKLRSAIRHLHRAPERRRGYTRSSFRIWDDADRDCRNTRAEVLRHEALGGGGLVRGRCTVRSGQWYSYYDDRYVGRPSKIAIDHLVPLREAWKSGARGWSRAKREAFANDLGDYRTLIAVSEHSERSKRDRDPARWLPGHSVCKYVGQWVAVKMRWGLAANGREKRALTRTSRDCRNVRITVRRARVVTVHTPVHHTSNNGPGAQPQPSTGGTHACTRTSSGTCIQGGQFCPQASYGHAGYDANGHRYICRGDRVHPHWMLP